MSSDDAVIRQVEELLERSLAAESSYERLRARYRAHEMLVTEAFLAGRVSLQRVFFELFPPSPALAERLEGSLAALRSRDVERRRTAAARLEKESRREKGMDDQMWLRDPRTVERLLEAAGDSDAEVQERAIHCLGGIVQGYDYPSREVLERLLSLHDEAEPNARREIAMALTTYDDPRKWPVLVDALSRPRLDELSRRRLSWAVQSQTGSMPREVARQLAARLLALLQAEKKAQLKTILLQALGAVGDAEIAAEVRKLKLQGVRPELREEVLRAMEPRSRPK